MARSKITNQSIQLQNDNGAVLWSFIDGEQQEFPVTLKFLTNIDGYNFEAVLIEGLNTGNGRVPKMARPNGAQTLLTTYTPPIRGLWSASTVYADGDVVYYNNGVSTTNSVYINISGKNAFTGIDAPNADPTNWKAYTNNVIKIRFPSNLINLWAVQPSPVNAVYGFFELRITEPIPTLIDVYQQTYKPMRGLVEIQYSPTDIVG